MQLIFLFIYMNYSHSAFVLIVTQQHFLNCIWFVR